MCLEEGFGEHGVIIMLEQKWKSGPSKLNSFILDPLNVMEGEDREKQHRGSAIWELTNAQDGVDGFGCWRSNWRGLEMPHSGPHLYRR